MSILHNHINCAVLRTLVRVVAVEFKLQEKQVTAQIIFISGIDLNHTFVEKYKHFIEELKQYA